MKKYISFTGDREVQYDKEFILDPLTVESVSNCVFEGCPPWVVIRTHAHTYRTGEFYAEVIRKLGIEVI